MSQNLPGYDSFIKSFGGLRDIPKPDKVHKQPFTYPKVCIDWKPEYQSLLLSLPYEKVLRFTNLSCLEEPLRSTWYRFLIKLDAYLDSTNPLQKREDLLFYAASGANGTKTQKRVKTASILKSGRTSTYESNPDLENIPAYTFTDIGQIFNPNYLPLWNEKVDDYKEGLAPVVKNEEALDLFKRTFRKIISSRKFRKVRWQEFALSSSGSKSLDQKGKKVPKWKSMLNVKSPATKIGDARRCIVPAKPGGFRDTVILSAEASLRVQWLDAQIMNLLEDIPEHIHLKSRRKIDKKINKIEKNNFFFYMRDIKKEGITKPRELLKIMLEVLKEEYPDVPAWECTEFYESFRLILENGSIIKPPRGHGLGMANSLTTLMNLTISEMVNYVDTDTEIIEEFDTLSLNDDFLAGFKTEEDLRTYEDKEKKVMDSLSILFAPKKSFSSRHLCLIAEEYILNGTRSRKESYQRASVLSALAATNIVEAKHLVNSVVNEETFAYWELYKREIISKWGYEFFPHEYTVPYELGGWVSSIINGINCVTIQLDNIDLKRYHFAAAKASKENSLHLNIRGKKEPLLTQIYKIYGNVKLTTSTASYVDTGTESQLKRKYFRYKEDPRAVLNSYEDLLERRKKIFKKNLQFNFSYQDVKEWLFLNIPDCYPTNEFIKEFVEVDFIEDGEADIYTAPNPLLSALAEENSQVEADMKESYSLEKPRAWNFKDRQWVSEKVTSMFGDIIPEVLCWKIMDSNIITRNLADDENIQLSFDNPARIGQLFAAKGINKMPILKEKFRPEFLRKKKKIYTDFIPIMFHSALEGIERRMIKCLGPLLREIINDQDLSTLELLEMIQKIRDEIINETPKEKPDAFDDRENEDISDAYGDILVHQDSTEVVEIILDNVARNSCIAAFIRSTTIQGRDVAGRFNLEESIQRYAAPYIRNFPNIIELSTLGWHLRHEDAQTREKETESFEAIGFEVFDW